MLSVASGGKVKDVLMAWDSLMSFQEAASSQEYQGELGARARRYSY